MGRWELHTDDRGWIPVADNARAVTKMSAESRHLCYRNPMCPSYTGVRWNDKKEFVRDPEAVEIL